ncbi:MAG: DNA primase [Lachnospiraceae bacterium]|nr:DNA primase [Lachnospiraceae bacterium]
MFFSDDFIEEVRSRNDIVDVVGERVHLERKGSNHFGLCPFHNEKSPSFSVQQSKQIFHCFGCGEGGNVFTFLMKYENMTFPEAVKELAHRAGMEVPSDDGADPGRSQELRDKKQTLLAINREAARYYYNKLHEESGARGLEYFRNRGLNDAVIRHFGLGFADTGGAPLTKYLRSKGYSDAQIIEAGLATNDEKRGIYDKFWNRVMFPIIDTGNRVIGFGGRVLGDGKPKYLNSPETPVFDKGRNLYGLNYAKNARAGNVIICEGYMDVIAMHSAGFTQAVASLGTALTQMQVNLLKRCAQDIVLSYDSDEAGVKAAKRAIGLIREAGLRGRVLNLAPYKDPDEFIKNEGRDAFAERVKNAESIYFFELRVAEKDYDLNDPEGRTAFIREAARKLSDFEEPIERDNYIAATADRYGVPLEDLRHMVADIAAREGIAAPARRRSTWKSPEKKQEESEEKLLKPQRMILTWISDEPGLLPGIEKYISPDDLTDELYRSVAVRMFEDIKKGDLVPARIISAYQDEEDQKRIAAIFDTPVNAGKDNSELSESERRRALEVLIKDIKKHAYEKESRMLDRASPDYFKQVVEIRKKIEELGTMKIEL